MKAFFILLFVSLNMNSSLLFAADRIGNGGGVWVCESSSKEILDIMFMDVFEARREYQLTLPEIEIPVTDFVQAKMTWIANFLGEGSKINQHIEYVQKNVTWIDDIINTIPDAANKISPHPSTCKQGEWKAVQLVNFTEDFRILVRREIFESPLMTDLERAAVYLHEGIYSYLRTELGDSTSVRARAIAGFILSDLPDSEKQVRIQNVLKQVNEPIDTGSGWICGIKPSSHSPFYIFEAVTEFKGKEGAVKACIVGEDPMPDFPFPIGDFGPQRECKMERTKCEPILSAEKKHRCILTDFFGKKEYPGIGRTILEAQREAMSQCLVNVGGSSPNCYNNDLMTCK